MSGSKVEPGRRLVLLLVGGYDRRATVALAQAWRIPARERRALHVAVDERRLRELGEAWMVNQPSMPLFTVENDGGVAASVARVARIETQSFDEVVVLAGRLFVPGLLGRLAHDHTAEKISRSLVGIPRVTVALTAVTVP